jgi:Barstar (barnase inhibitor)
MDIKAGLQRVNALDVETIQRQTLLAGYATYVLPADGIIDRASFFNAARATFPLDPPLKGSSSWDALSDSLWEGLYTQPARRIVILWPGARAMANSAPADFETAVNVLDDIANALSDPGATIGDPKEVAVLVGLEG